MGLRLRRYKRKEKKRLKPKEVEHSIKIEFLNKISHQITQIHHL
jgi:hypothetical protein